jgi:D-sedoheptulose 7-phosphate isomerase
MARFDRDTLVEPPAAEVARSRIQESVAAHRALLEDDGVADEIAGLADRIVESLRDGGKVILFGNGGSAADATHLAAEFVGRFRFDRPPLPALSLSDNGSSVSGIGNDYGYEDVFARQLDALGSPGDVAIGISTSGTSPNVVAGLRTARSGGLHAVALTGAGGGDLRAEADQCLCMPSTETARIQECYMLAGHVVCELVEQTLFGDGGR